MSRCITIPLPLLEVEVEPEQEVALGVGVGVVLVGVLAPGLSAQSPRVCPRPGNMVVAGCMSAFAEDA